MSQLWLSINCGGNHNIVLRRLETVSYIPYFVVYLFLAYRFEVNTDWPTYIEHYSNIDKNFNITNFGSEYIFWLWMYVFYHLGLGFYEFQASSTIVDLALIYYIVKNYKFGLIFLLVYLIFNGGVGFRLEVNLMRQTKSILLFCLSIKYLVEGRFFKYSSINILGSLFHVTSLIYIPLYFVFKIKCSSKAYSAIYILGAFIFIFQVDFLSNIMGILGEDIGRISYLTRIYIESDIFSQRKGFSLAFFERSLIFFLVLFLMKKVNVIYNHAILNVSFCYLFVYLFFSEMIIFSDRFSLLFLPGIWLSLCLIYRSSSLVGKFYFLASLFIYAVIKHFGFTPPYYLEYNQFIF
ncbi:EpsG family protein [Vibrio cyclitrophicus]